MELVSDYMRDDTLRHSRGAATGNYASCTSIYLLHPDGRNINERVWRNTHKPR